MTHLLKNKSQNFRDDWKDVNDNHLRSQNIELSVLLRQFHKVVSEVTVILHIERQKITFVHRPNCPVCTHAAMLKISPQHFHICRPV